MLFNSLHYAFFFVGVFIFYWLVANRNLRLQNAFLLAASYFFYASWDYRFLVLLILSTLVNYFTGLKIHHAHSQHRKLWLWITVVVNLGVLGIFKYYNFFIASFAAAMSNAGFAVSPWTLNILLPLGISFYTFHGLSYVFDTYRNKIKPTYDFIDFGVFVGFFPLLIAGPIERAAHLLPQIQRSRIFNYNQTVDGLRQILWGLFKKIVIADNCGIHVNAIFENPEAYSSSTLLWGAILFSFQIYGDFSGYSDIATGSARMLGFDLIRNFAYPYFSRDIAEFWRRWHMSLNTWLRDYLYIPLGGNKGSRLKVTRNIFIVFLVSGLWHGANWTFLFWGFIHALFFLPLLLSGTHRKHLGTAGEGRWLPNALEFTQMASTFMLVTLARIFFRAPNLDQAFGYFGKLFSASLFTLPERGLWLIPFIMMLLGTEWIQRDRQHGLQLDAVPRQATRWVVYVMVIGIIFCFGANLQKFIYFQF